MTDPTLSPDVQALIDEALARQRDELITPTASTPAPAPEIRHSQASATAVGKSDAWAHAQLEALRRPLHVEFRGEHFDIPPADAWLVDFTDLMQSSSVKPALTLALGEEGYARFRALDPAPGMIDHLALAERISAAVNAGDS